MRPEKRMVGRRLSLAALCAAVWTTGLTASAHAQQNDARAGAQRYMEYCAGCHGTDGGGGSKGPSLTGDRTTNRSDDELNTILHNGTAGGMPPFAQIGDANLHALIAFLRLMENSTAAHPQPGPPGDPQAGQALYFGKAQCSTCHMLNGHGGFMARSLTDYARNRTPEAILAAILHPDHPLIPSSRVVTVNIRDGKPLTGVLRNEDAFTLDVQTTDGRYHLLSRSSVVHVDYTNHSLMPGDYGTRLSNIELNDIVSFLMSVDKTQQSSEGSGR